MAVLDQITEMKKQGLPTGQIMQKLKEQGASPKEINEAISQSEIKSEIDQSPNVFPETPETGLTPPAAQPVTPGTTQPTAQPTTSIDGMQPSIGQPQAAQPAEPLQLPTPEPTALSAPAPIESASEEYAEYPEYTPQEYYPEYQEYQPPQATDIETIRDIADQIIEEKTKSFRKDLASFTKFQRHTEEKIKEMDKKLIKIETILEELQISILRKIGSYGEDLKKISKEMKTTQDSFSKVINPLTEKGREEITESAKTKKETPTKGTRTKKTSQSFEDYLR